MTPISEPSVRTCVRPTTCAILRVTWPFRSHSCCPTRSFLTFIRRRLYFRFRLFQLLIGPQGRRQGHALQQVYLPGAPNKRRMRARVQLVLSLRIALSLNVRAFFPGCSIPSIHFLPAQQQISISTRSKVCLDGLISRPILQLAQLSLTVHCCSLFFRESDAFGVGPSHCCQISYFCGVAPAQAVCLNLHTIVRIWYTRC